MSAPPAVERSERLRPADAGTVLWQTVVWNDPVNLMSYVVHVFRSYFGFSRAEATRLMRGPFITTVRQWWLTDRASSWNCTPR